MNYDELLFALHVHNDVDKALKEDAVRQNTDIDSFTTKERYEEYVMRTVRRLHITAEIISRTPLEKKESKTIYDSI